MEKFKTKNSIGFFTLVFLLTIMVGCKDKVVEKEVIVMPGTTTESTTIIEKETPAADTTTTSISPDNKGLKVEAEKVDVKIGN